MRREGSREPKYCQECQDKTQILEYWDKKAVNDKWCNIEKTIKAPYRIFIQSIPVVHAVELRKRFYVSTMFHGLSSS